MQRCRDGETRDRDRSTHGEPQRREREAERHSRRRGETKRPEASAESGTDRFTNVAKAVRHVQKWDSRDKRHAAMWEQ